MTDLEIRQQIRSKELQIKTLEAEIREARGYIAGLRRRLSDSSSKRSASGGAARGEPRRVSR